MVSLDVNIRFAHERDIDAITSIYEQAVLLGTVSFEIDPPDEKEMLRRMQQVFAFKAPYLVAELEGQILGFAYASAYRPRAAYRFTVQDSIYVHPECRSVGVGTQLLTSLISECEIRGFSQMIAIIGDSENKASIGLHKHCGFEHVGTLKNVGFKFDRWLDSVLMQKTLSASQN